MKRIFEIEFPNELGEMWMNQDNLMLCINAYCDNRDGRIKATDVTDSVVRLSKDQSLPCLPDEPEEDTLDVGYKLGFIRCQEGMFKWRKVDWEE